MMMLASGYKAERNPGLATGLETGYRIGLDRCELGSVFCNITATRTSTVRVFLYCLSTLDAQCPTLARMQHHRRCPRLAGGLAAAREEKTLRMRTDMARRTTFLPDVAFCTSFPMRCFRWWGLTGAILGGPTESGLTEYPSSGWSM